MEKIKWKELFLSLGISLGVGAVSSFLTSDSRDQYEALYKPPLAPPGWLFPIVWTILFILMGIAAYLVWQSDSEKKKNALFLYGIQLAFNMVWSVIFFGFEAYFFAFVWLVILWYLILLTLQRFYEIDKRAGYLLIPYLAWVTFAGYLNLLIALNS